MISRRRTVMAFVVAASVVLAAGVTPVRADALSSSTNPPYYYVLTSSQAIPASASSASGPLVVFEAPPNSIVPGPVDPSTGQATSPVTPDPSPYVATDGKTYTTDPQYTTSQDVFVFTRETTSALTGQPVEDLGFAFKNGLAANSPFVFALSLADPNNPPTLTSITQGVANYPFPAPQAQTSPATTAAATGGGTSSGLTTTDTSTTTTNNTPEPLSLILWSALTAAGLLRARAHRRRAV